MEASKWIPFDLDVNLFYGTISTREKWNEVVGRYRAIYSDIEDLTKTTKLSELRKENTRPGFSYKGGGITLAEWAAQNKIDLAVPTA